jgi:hypothetical protein
LDRETQENEFNTFWTDAHISRSGAPQIYLLPAMMEDCADYFTERLRDDTVERLARSFKGADRGAIDRVTIEGQPRYQSLEVLKQDFSLQLFMELGALDLWNRSDPSARLLGEHERFRLPAFVFIEHTITTDPASAILGDFFPWYFNEFWSEFKTEAKVLIFLHLEFSPLQELAPWLPRIFRRRSSGSYDRLQTQLRTALPSSEANLSPGAPGAPVKRLSPLPPIKSPDIEHWLQRLGIPRSDIKPTMQTDFGDVCRKRGPDVRFLQVQKRLETLYQRRMQVESLHGKQLQGTA